MFMNMCDKITLNEAINCAPTIQNILYVGQCTRYLSYSERSKIYLEITRKTANPGLLDQCVTLDEMKKGLKNMYRVVANKC